MHRLVFALAILLSIVFSLIPADVSAQDGDLATIKEATVENYADIVFYSYEDSYTLAVELQTAIDAFVAEPSEDTFQAAKDAWLAAREPYGQTEAYRFYGGPIDDADGPEGLINAWPLDEVYIDYVEGMPDAGIINDVENYPEITAELLESLNEVGAGRECQCGFPMPLSFCCGGKTLMMTAPVHAHTPTTLLMVQLPTPNAVPNIYEFRLNCW